MNELRLFFQGPYSSVEIDLSDRRWHIKARIPRVAGWYFISTDAPVRVLSRQTLWAAEYAQSRSGVLASVKNYCIADRAVRYGANATRFWNPTIAYAGLASNLQSRAREHTFADPGTAALALGRYPELRPYTWLFNFFTLNRHEHAGYDDKLVLLIGEQLWRIENGWPLLCAE